MLIAKIAITLYGLLAIIGGVIGYKTAGSKVSLISGSISGVLLFVGGIASFLGQSWGLILATIITAILVIVFIARLLKTQKFMPAGLMIISGVIVLVVTVPQILG
ncbi:MAG: TMEM14 family protein [Halothece sp. Uz-M2-17]|nr:TMEM14 family protein [Halothece sp. Uz-M2-17]